MIRRLKCTHFYGDSDSWSCKSVVDADSYNGKLIVKQECVGHYQKSLGIAFHKAAKEKKLGVERKIDQSCDL
jgi:hypothetical protein